MPLNISKPNRVDSLDYLRGLMAFLIMLYHYFSWHYYGFDSKDFMGRIGVYGVSMFYILSGLTLYIVYKEKLFLNGYWQYFKRRILRIYPLLILITLLTIFLLKNYIYVLTTARPLESLLLNISGIFGFVEPKRYIATGAWSIGNELVFYVFFPVILILTKWKNYMLFVFFAISLVIGCYFAYFIIDTDVSLSKNWEAYINPFNQIFLFIGGMVIAEIFYFGRLKSLAWPNFLILLFLLLFIFYPANGDRVNIISNANRFIFSFCCFFIVISFLKSKIILTKWVSFPFKTLGDISYTLYLLHPLVYYTLLKYSLLPENKEFSFIICIITTLLFSVIIYNLIEKPFMKLGRK
tara:strand:+ start:13 stop:1065 length:1053 start_codon:yes stop_codon:yes gene_type:complete